MIFFALCDSDDDLPKYRGRYTRGRTLARRNTSQQPLRRSNRLDSNTTVDGQQQADDVTHSDKEVDHPDPTAGINAMFLPNIFTEYLRH